MQPVAGHRISTTTSLLATLIALAVAALAACSGSTELADSPMRTLPPAQGPEASPSLTDPPQSPEDTPHPDPTLTPAIQPSPIPSPAVPPPTVLSALSSPTPAPTSEPSQDGDRVTHPCPPYPILLSPAAQLETATQAAADVWNAYLGCSRFELARGGIPVLYSANLDGCPTPDVAACAFNGVFLSPSEPLYDPASVVAHELGHILNYVHATGPPIMHPELWFGPLTVWCSPLDLCL